MRSACDEFGHGDPGKRFHDVDQLGGVRHSAVAKLLGNPRCIVTENTDAIWQIKMVERFRRVGLRRRTIGHTRSEEL